VEPNPAHFAIDLTTVTVLAQYVAPVTLSTAIVVALRACYEAMSLDQIFRAWDILDPVLRQLETATRVVLPLNVMSEKKRRTANAAGAFASAKAVPSPAGAAALHRYILHSDLYRCLVKRHKASTELQAMVSDYGPEWTQLKKGDRPEEGTFYKEEKGMGTHSFRVVGTVKQSMFRIVTVLLELDLYTEWFPFCKVSEEVASLTRFAKIAKIVVQCPWPVANREVLLSGYGVDSLGDRRVLICTQSCKENCVMANGKPVPPVGSGNVRAFILVGGFVLEALNQTTTKVSFVMNLDPMLANVPYWVLNWISGKFMWVLLWQLERSANFDEKSKYAMRQREKQELYKYIQERANAAGFGTE